MSGAKSYHKGLLAEEQVEAAYLKDGASLLARRWRSGGGEIDLIFKTPATLIFVEVKSSKTLDRAAAMLGPRQIARLISAGEIWLAKNGGLDQNTRFDVALVDANGGLRRIENAIFA